MSEDEYELAYSSTGKVDRKNKTKKKGYTPSKGPIRLRLEKKGRGGKSVTVLYNIPLSESDAKKLMKKLQSHLACGATLKNSTIELAGDNRERVEEYLKKK